MLPSENMGMAREAVIHPTKPQKDDDDDMPTLGYTGSFLQEEGLATTPEEEDDDHMPPLEYMGNSAQGETTATQSQVDVDNDMPPLEHVGCSKPASF